MYYLSDSAYSKLYNDLKYVLEHCEHKECQSHYVADNTASLNVSADVQLSPDRFYHFSFARYFVSVVSGKSFKYQGYCLYVENYSPRHLSRSVSLLQTTLYKTDFADKCYGLFPNLVSAVRSFVALIHTIVSESFETFSESDFLQLDLF